MDEPIIWMEEWKDREEYDMNVGSIMKYEMDSCMEQKELGLIEWIGTSLGSLCGFYRCRIILVFVYSESYVYVCGVNSLYDMDL